MRRLAARAWLGWGFALGAFASNGCDSRPLDGSTPGAAGDGGQAGGGGNPATGTWLDRTRTELTVVWPASH